MPLVLLIIFLGPGGGAALTGSACSSNLRQKLNIQGCGNTKHFGGLIGCSGVSLDLIPPWLVTLHINSEWHF